MSVEHHIRKEDNADISSAVLNEVRSLSSVLTTHVKMEDDRSVPSLLKRNAFTILGLFVQLIVLTWWAGDLVAEVKRNQEVMSVKLTMLESRMTDWYSKGDAAKDAALSATERAELKRRMDRIEFLNEALREKSRAASGGR